MTIHTEVVFADVTAAVEKAPGLTPGVRSNLRGAVLRAAQQMSPAALQGPVDVPKLNRWLTKATAASMGFQSAQSLAAFTSNLRRALILAGVDIMPGRDRTPLRPEWQSLWETIPDEPSQRALSRFFRFASRAGWNPQDIAAAHVERFHAELQTTALRSKADKLTRLMVRAWRHTQLLVPGWPKADIRPTQRSDRFYAQPWSAFPSSLKADVDAFVSRGDTNWLRKDTKVRPLRPATRLAYTDAFQRMASLLVTNGIAPEALHSLTDLVQPDRVEIVLTALAKRSERSKGGSLGYIAALALATAKHWCRLDARALELLDEFWESVKPPEAVMADRTPKRLRQFDDPAAINALLDLPDRLAAMAKKHGTVDNRSAKLMRAALYLRLLTDTTMRSGNIVGLRLDRHFVGFGPGLKGDVYVEIPSDEVKNGVALSSLLQRETVRLLRRYIDEYRSFHCSAPSLWLFPRQDGSRWSGAQACADVIDLAARHIGLDVTPHLLRSVAGKIILDQHPDAYRLVQQLLGHKNIETTHAFYAPLEPAKARKRYHGLIQARGQASMRRAGV